MFAIVVAARCPANDSPPPVTATHPTQPIAHCGQSYQRGSWLPSERELAQEYAADRSTVRRALRILGERGIVTVTSGAGAQVSLGTPMPCRTTPWPTGVRARARPALRRRRLCRRSRRSVGRDGVAPANLLVARPLGAEACVGAAVVLQARSS
ncbi:MAG: GntR family transcriptional regulator, partial [Pseudonocardiaceae bacterium]